MVNAVRTDEFGMSLRYCFMFLETSLTEAQLAAAKIACDHHEAELVVVGDSSDEACGADSEQPHLTWSRFLSLLGGPVSSAAALDPDFPSNLETLGRCQLPARMSGNPDDLFEAFVRIALEFCLATRGVSGAGPRRRP